MRTVVGVMGSGTRELATLAEAAGRVVARGGHHLLTGGGNGVMLAAARAFTSVAGRPGLSMGIVRADGTGHLGEDARPRAYRARGPNPYVELPIFTHLPDSGTRGKSTASRNHINVLSSTVVVVLPGDDGTASELDLALEYGRPVILFLGDDGRVAGRTARELQERWGTRLAVATSEADLERRLATACETR